MKLIIRDAKKGVVASWYLADEDTLVVNVAKDLDEVSKQRYITQAKREKGFVEERRRRIAIPFILPAGRQRTAGQQTAVVAGAVVVVAAVAAAAAVMIPAALDSNADQTHRPPVRAAAPPNRPGPSSAPGSGPPKSSASPSARPAPSGTSTPGHSAAPTKQAARPAQHGHSKPSLGHSPTLPSLPVDLPPIATPSGPVTVTTPGPRRLLCIRIDLGIQARIGCRRS